ncbi:3-dehydroquinate synthase [Edaphobacter flagellatus]|uniref:3-dehydroquinate synthase n=1 Tax=Edaphobacter flagellatus TaxID=1933044 RepID=UPI0021B3760A|nr:3-dehydroquinate synthase [Edaphobacter flagellatus]
MPVIPLKTPSASYEIMIASGLLKTLRARLKKIKGGKPYRVFIVTSPEIWGLWGKRMLASFAKNEQPTVLFIPAGERYKRMRTIESLAEQLAEAGADRDALLVAFGGGVVGDMTGFLAAIYMRGVPYVQVPTTLLAQVDSAIGGKTGTNLAAGKNLVGSFHHPLAVLADTDVLATLPAAELRAGLQESIKAGVIRDAKLFAYLERNADAVLRGDAKALTHVVAASVRVKADVVANDEKESGLRMILNYGHTLGHAIEAATGYKQLLHGEAVGWGSIAATRLGWMRGMITEREAERIIALILSYGPLSEFRATAEKLVALTANDKKNRSGSLSFVLPRKIGEVAIVRDVTREEMLAAAEWMLELMRYETAVTKPLAKKRA